MHAAVRPLVTKVNNSREAGPTVAPPSSESSLRLEVNLQSKLDDARGIILACDDPKRSSVEVCIGFT